jgi:hypothetical protein
MRNYEIIKEDRKIITKLKCNKCNKEFTQDDWVDWQEFFTYNGMGGYGSVFGDSCPYELDLCQNCFYELVKDYIKYTEE